MKRYDFMLQVTWLVLANKSSFVQGREADILKIVYVIASKTTNSNFQLSRQKGQRGSQPRGRQRLREWQHQRA